jgi:type IV secretory pathway TrbF-like protein
LLTPNEAFLAARSEWDNRLSNQAASRANWRLLALALLVLDGLLSAGLYHLASTSRITPYVVEVDRHGHALAFGPAERLREPDERLYRYQLSLFISNLRTVYGPANPRAQKEALDRAYAYVRQPASSRIADWFRVHNPFSADADLVSVDVTSILRLEQDLWQIEWTESHYGRDGSRLFDEPWQAIVHVQLSPPVKTDQVLVNPLGLFVTHIDWTRVPHKEIAR